MNFGGISPYYSDYKTSPIMILPVPFDATSAWIKGVAWISRKIHARFHVVEPCPVAPNEVSDFLLSKLICQLLSYRFKV